MSIVEVKNNSSGFKPITITLENFEEAQAIWCALNVGNLTIQEIAKDNFEFSGTTLTTDMLLPKSKIFDQLDEVFNLDTIIKHNNKPTIIEVQVKSSMKLRLLRDTEFVREGNYFQIGLDTPILVNSWAWGFAVSELKHRYNHDGYKFYTPIEGDSK
jgi:hypothetical protein